MEKKLNLGSGNHKKEGFVNLDWNLINNPDVAHDLNKFPYPFKDNTFDSVEAFHILEHLEKPFLVMKELHRILRPGGRPILKVPHFSRGFTRAEHSHGFDVTFPFYFDKRFAESLSGFQGFEFELEKMEFHWFAFTHLLSMLGYKRITILFLSLVNALVSFLANLSPQFCSRIWCYWIGGFEEIEFEFIAKK